MRTSLAGLLVATGLVLAVPGPAHACSCVTARPAQLVEWADAVVWAEVADVQMPVTGTGAAHYLLEVQTVYKGEAYERVQVDSAASGAACGLEGIDVDRRYVFFLQRSQPDEGLDGLWGVRPGTWTASLCGGTGMVDRDAVERVVGPGAPAGSNGDRADRATQVGTTPRPGGPERLPVSGFAYAGMGVGLLGGIVTALLVWRRQRSGAA